MGGSHNMFLDKQALELKLVNDLALESCEHISRHGGLCIRRRQILMPQKRKRSFVGGVEFEVATDTNFTSQV